MSILINILTYSNKVLCGRSPTTLLSLSPFYYFIPSILLYLLTSIACAREALSGRSPETINYNNNNNSTTTTTTTTTNNDNTNNDHHHTNDSDTNNDNARSSVAGVRRSAHALRERRRPRRLRRGTDDNDKGDSNIISIIIA